MTDIATALHDLLNEPDLPVDEAVARHFTAGYRQRTDGVWADRAGFSDHIAHLRKVVAHARVDVRDEVRNGNCYADRHVVEIVKRDGGRVTQEVYLFGVLASDGRFERVEEATMMLEGAEADRGIGTAK